MDQRHDEVLLHALEWRFSARDFVPLLEKLPIFQILAQGSRINESYYQVSAVSSFERKKLTVFKEVFFSICARIASGEAVSTIKLKKGGKTLIPELSRRKSLLNQDSSE